MLMGECVTGTFLCGFSIVGQSSTSIIQGIDEQKTAGPGGTTRSQVTGEPHPVSIPFLLESKQFLEVIYPLIKRSHDCHGGLITFECKVQRLGGEITDDVGGVTTPEGKDTFFSGSTAETLNDTVITFGKTSGLNIGQYLVNQ